MHIPSARNPIREFFFVGRFAGDCCLLFLMMRELSRNRPCDRTPSCSLVRRQSSVVRESLVLVRSESMSQYRSLEIGVDVAVSMSRDTHRLWEDPLCWSCGCWCRDNHWLCENPLCWSCRVKAGWVFVVKFAVWVICLFTAFRVWGLRHVCMLLITMVSVWGGGKLCQCDRR